MKCYTRPDDRDKECQDCILYKWCCEELLDELPDCYGMLYREDEICRSCLLRKQCGAKETKPGGRDPQYEVWPITEKGFLSNVLSAYARYRKHHQNWPEHVFVDKKHKWSSWRKGKPTQKHPYPYIMKNEIYMKINPNREETTNRTPILEPETRQATTLHYVKLQEIEK